jgi:hypothetical protein
LASERVDEGLRKQFDFIRRIQPYRTKRELEEMGFLTFFTVLDEASAEEKARLDHLSNLTGQ